MAFRQTLSSRCKPTPLDILVRNLSLHSTMVYSDSPDQPDIHGRCRSPVSHFRWNSRKTQHGRRAFDHIYGMAPRKRSKPPVLRISYIACFHAEPYSNDSGRRHHAQLRWKPAQPRAAWLSRYTTAARSATNHSATNGNAEYLPATRSFLRRDDCASASAPRRKCNASPRRLHFHLAWHIP